MKRLRLFISGKVQGVWYRESMRQEAEDRGIVGWVQNLPDGRVEALVEGREDRVDDLIAWARKGPPHARVDGVAVTKDDGRYPFMAFTVRR